MKANVNFARVVELVERLDALKAEVQVMAIPDRDKGETPQYQEMLKVLEELRKAMYGE
jgi:hypothetical protein